MLLLKQQNYLVAVVSTATAVVSTVVAESATTAVESAQFSHFSVFELPQADNNTTTVKIANNCFIMIFVLFCFKLFIE
jgi:hypothetical protein